MLSDILLLFFFHFLVFLPACALFFISSDVVVFYDSLESLRILVAFLKILWLFTYLIWVQNLLDDVENNYFFWFSVGHKRVIFWKSKLSFSQSPLLSIICNAPISATHGTHTASLIDIYETLIMVVLRGERYSFSKIK